MSFEKEKKQIHIWGSYYFIAKTLCKEQKVLTICLTVLTVILGLVSPAYIWLTGIFVDRVEQFIRTGSFDPLIITIIGFLSLLFFQQIINSLADTVKSFLRERISFRLQVQLMQKASELDISFFEHNESYEKMHRANKVFGNKIIHAFQDFLYLFSTIISIIGYIAILVSVNVIVCIIILSVIIPSLALKLRRSYDKYIVNYNDITPVDRKKSYYEQLLTDVNVLKERKNYNLFEVFYDRWTQLQNQVKNMILSNVYKEIKTSLTVDLLNMVAYGVTLSILCFSILFGTISVAAFVMLSQTVTRLQSDVEAIVNFIRSLYEQGLHFNDLTEFLEDTHFKEKETETEINQPLPHLQHQIRFENVSFQYPNSPSWALKNLHFTIHKGETVAIIGVNGSGKTTLVKLLASLYEPTDGKIYFDDVNTERFTRKQIRDQISVIFQNHAHFKLTLSESIGLGNIAKMEDRDVIQTIASQCDVDRLASELPNGYDTFLSKEFGGAELSGGQWQKVAFARCLMKDSPIIILDEPTSALDPIAEMNMLQQYIDLTKNKTTFLISHRIGSAKLADRILVLDDGQLIEMGTHDELLRKQGHYYRLFSRQSQWYEDAGDAAV